MTAGRVPPPHRLPTITTLFDGSDGEAAPLSATLRDTYDGPLTFPARRPHVYANFVSTIDGLVSYGVRGQASAGVISGGEPTDRFVMGLLRACADVIVSGAGTLRVERKATWTPWQVYPAAASLYRELRRDLGRPERIPVAIVTASGDVDLSLPVFRSDEVDPIVVTSLRGAERLATRSTDRVRVRAVGEGEPSMRAVLDAIVEETGGGLILSEAGPRLFGRMLREGVVDELFLTVAPRIAGRSEERPGISLVYGTAFDPGDAPSARLVSVKRSENDFLLLRYALRSVDHGAAAK